MDVKSAPGFPTAAAPAFVGPPAGPLHAKTTAPETPVPQDLTLVVSSQNLADANQTQPLPQGQSLTELPLVETVTVKPSAPPASLVLYDPRPIMASEMEQVLKDYNDRIRDQLSKAKPGSELARFATCLNLLANLKDQRLQKDPQAWDVLQMRSSQIEEEYRRLMRSPEIQATFTSARGQALKQVFGQDLSLRAKQQAAWLMSPDFRAGLDSLKPAEVQAKIQQALSNLAALDPGLAAKVADDLLRETVSQQALASLQQPGEDGDAARAGLANAFSVYLKAQQTAAGIGMQASSIARLSSLSDEKMGELTKAVASLAQNAAPAKDAQQLAQSLLNKVDDLPAEIRPDATALIGHLHTQNILGTVLLAGSVAGLMRSELPNDASAWLSLTTASLSTASMSHFAFRLAGLDNAADMIGKLNAKLPLGSLKIPVLGSVLTGVNTTLDAMAFVNELNNEDTVGAATRAMSVGSGIATLAAITVMSGPAAPVTLIGATVVGLTAWGIDSMWGESDLTGKLRQQLRKLEISEAEQKALERAKAGKLPDAATPQSERVALINALMDQATSGGEESLIHRTLMQTPDAELLPLLERLHLPRLSSELERDEQVLEVMNRAAALAKAQTPVRLGPMLAELAKDQRGEALARFLSAAPPEALQALPEAALGQLVETLRSGWGAGPGEFAAISALLAHPGLATQSDNLLAREGVFDKLRGTLPGPETAVLLRRILVSPRPDLQALASRLLARPEAQLAGSLSPLTGLGSNAIAARLSYEALKGLGNSQLQALPPENRKALYELLSRSAWAHRSDPDAQRVIDALQG